MSLEGFNYIAEIIASFAVIVSLIYLAVQLRQNTNAVRLSTMHNVTEELRDWNKGIAGNGSVASILLRGMQNPDDMGGEDKLRFYCLLYSMFWALENAFVQHNAGALDADEWAGIRQSFTDFGKLPGMQDYWSNRKHWFGPKFQRFMDTEVMSASASEGYRAAGT